MRKRGLLMLWGALALAANVVALALPAPTVRADPPEKSADTLAYTIEARLDAKTYEIDAAGTLVWVNQTDTPVPEMRLHLYLNAFKNDLSTFMRESKGSHRGHKVDPRARGWTDLLSFKRKGGEELVDPANLTFWHGDDGNTDDQTVVVIPLKEPIPANGTATFELAWKSKMPKVFARTGYGGNGAFFMVAQWYPKPGVWEKEDGAETCSWNCHQFHGSSEFYADYGRYDVTLTVPARFEEKLGASGLRVDLGDASTEHKGRKNEDGTVSYRHQVEDVHDFAWVCGEDFEVHEMTFEGGAGTDPAEQERVAKILGRPVEALNLRPVTVYYLLQPEHADQLDRHRKAVENALMYMGFWFGQYPYPTLTVVDPDHRGADAGGMEYPTLITGGTRYIRAEKQLSPEGVLVHEFGHQHFYGLVGSNEFRHAWMDEGMNTYATGKVLMKAYDPWESVTWYGGFPVYGEAPFKFRGLAAESRGNAVPIVAPLFDDEWKVPFGSLGIVKSIASGLGIEHPDERISLWGQYGEVTPLSFLREVPWLTHLRPRPASTKEYERSRSADMPLTDPIAGRRAWEYMDRGSYGNNSYRRTASSLRTLEGYVGEPTMVRIMRTYCERFRFQHPRPEDFYDTAVEVAKADGKGDVRWLLEALFESTQGLDYGIAKIEADEAPRLDPNAKPAPDVPKVFESTVLVRRFEGMRLPIDVRVVFEDGSEREFLWDRDDSLREYTLEAGEAAGSRVRKGLAEEPVGPLAGDLSRVTPQRDTQQRWVKIRFRGPSKVAAAEIDPRYRYSLDRNRINDGRTTTRNVGPSLQVALRALGWVQLGNSFYGGL
jgi:hypothetical protein